MMGLSPADVTTATESLGLAALGANCGRSLDDTTRLVSEFLEAGLSSPLWVKPNAGVPKWSAAGSYTPRIRTHSQSELERSSNEGLGSSEDVVGPPRRTSPRWAACSVDSSSFAATTTPTRSSRRGPRLPTKLSGAYCVTLSPE